MKKLFIVLFLLVSLSLIKSDDITKYYVTEHGKSYHLETCRTIQKSKKIQITLSEVKEKGYKPCKVCKPDKE